MASFIKHGLKPFIKNHKKLYFFTKCLKERNNSEFIDKVLETNANWLYFQHRGEACSDKIVYDITIGRKGYGFFAEYRDMLDFLYFADEHGLTPSVEFGELFNYEPFSFTKYFKPVSGLAREDVLVAKNVVEAIDKHRYGLNRFATHDNAYGVTDEYVSSRAFVTAKYIELSDEMKIYIDESKQGFSDIKDAAKRGFSDIKDASQEVLSDMSMSNVLGVHVRGTDFKAGYIDHPAFVTFEEYLEKTIEVMEKKGFEKVFIATDDDGALDLFKSHLGDKLLYFTDVNRATGDKAVVFDDKTLSPFELGKQVLRDMMTLAECGGIIMGLSNVGVCSLITNKAKFPEFKSVTILDKGINKTGRDFDLG